MVPAYPLDPRKGLKKQASTVQQTSRSMEEISVSALTLADLAEELIKMVEQFSA